MLTLKYANSWQIDMKKCENCTLQIIGQKNEKEKMKSSGLNSLVREKYNIVDSSKSFIHNLVTEVKNPD